MASEKQPLELKNVIGFGGKVPNGLICHHDGIHHIYSLGSTVVVKNTRLQTQAFLQGHTHQVSCLALSHDGTKLASGQVTHMGFVADIIIWDLTSAMRSASGEGKAQLGEEIILQRLARHKVKVQDISFSPSDRLLASLGGQDDNQLIIWSVETGRALCGTAAANDSSQCVRYFNNDDNKLITGGNYNLRVWEWSKETRKLIPTDVRLQLQRIFKSIAIKDDDSLAYVGTMTGDLLEIDLRPKIPKFNRASKERFSQGILSIVLPEKGVVIGSGSGLVAAIGSKSLGTVCKSQLMGAATSLAPVREDGVLTGIYMGTGFSNIYYCPWNQLKPNLDAQLRATCHYSSIQDICFPKGYNRVFVTCANNDIRVWHMAESRELLRIQVPNLVCNCVSMAPDGSLIMSGWSDGKVRAFFPESGLLKFIIHDAHSDGVTAVACTNDGTRCVTGGVDGRVRMWGMRNQDMIASLKEHKATITSITIRDGDEECVSASDDGSCMVWDLRRYTRNQAMFASTLFRGILYHPDESQLLTCGSDRKLSYWDAYDGTAIRVIEGSNQEINSIDITKPDGNVFVSGGNDKTVRVWDYDDGICHFIGEGHSGNINKVAIAPGNDCVVSVGGEGAIFIWGLSKPAIDEGKTE